MNSPAAPYRVGHAGYVSEFELFLNEFLEHHPDVGRDQKRGWYIWWDHRVDQRELDKPRDDVPVKSYNYD